MDSPLIIVAEAPLPRAKELRRSLAAAGLHAEILAPSCCTPGG